MLDKKVSIVGMLVMMAGLVLGGGGGGCSYSFYMLEPTVGSTLYMGPTDTFTMSGCYTATGSPCLAEFDAYAQYWNGSWRNLTTSGNLSTMNDNPQYAELGCYGPTVQWTVTANDAWIKNYNVRIMWTTNPTGNASINVTAPAADTCGTLTASKTLANDITTSGNCITIGANNIVLNCAGHTITYAANGGTSINLFYGITNSGYNGTTIKNCIVRSGAFSFDDGGGDVLGGKGLLFTNTYNTTIINNTLYVQGTVSTTNTNFEFSGGVYNLSMINNSANLGYSDVVYINGINLDLNDAYNSTVINFTSTNTNGGNTHRGIRMGGVSSTGTIRNVTISSSNITLSDDGDAISAAGVIQNLTINSSIIRLFVGSSKGIYLSGGNDVYVLGNNITSADNCVTVASTTRALFGNSSFSCVGSDISASNYVNNTYFRNVTLNKTQVTTATSSNLTIQWYGRVNVTGSTSIGLTATVNDTQNTTLSNQTFYGYQALSSWFLVNDTTFSSTANVIYNRHTIITNLTGYTTNITFFNWTGRDYTTNITLYTSSANSCTYAGSGNWVIQFADMCAITNSQYLGSNTLTFNGSSGYVTFGNPTGATLVVTASKFYWNGTGSVYMWFKNSTWFNGTM